MIDKLLSFQNTMITDFYLLYRDYRTIQLFQQIEFSQKHHLTIFAYSELKRKSNSSRRNKDTKVC